MPRVFSGVPSEKQGTGPVASVSQEGAVGHEFCTVVVNVGRWKVFCASRLYLKRNSLMVALLIVHVWLMLYCWNRSFVVDPNPGTFAPAAGNCANGKTT